MAEDPEQPDFTFDANEAPARPALKLLYDRVLSGTTKPTVDLGSVTGDVARSSLRAWHDRYVAALGKRSSGILQRMDLVDRVELVGLADG